MVTSNSVRIESDKP